MHSSSWDLRCAAGAKYGGGEEGAAGEGSVAAGDGGVEAFVAVVQVRAEGVALALPEGVAGVVVAEDKAEDLLDALLPQRLFGGCDQAGGDPCAAAVRVHAEMVDQAAAAVVAGQDDPDERIVPDGGKAGVRVSAQIARDPFAGIVHGVQRPAALFRCVPQGADGVIVVVREQTDGNRHGSQRLRACRRICCCRGRGRGGRGGRR